MAERRMFAKSIVLSDAFLDMSLGARCLYITMNMLADDDGFVNSPKSIMRQVGASEDDLKVLAAKKFILPFESGVIVIKHWRIHNYLRGDTYSTTNYRDERAALYLENNKAYTFEPTGHKLEDFAALKQQSKEKALSRLSCRRRHVDDTSTTRRRHVDDTSTTRRRHVDDTSTTRRRHVDDSSTQVSLGKVSLGKVSLGKVSKEKKERKATAFQPPTLEEVTAYCRERNSSVDPKVFFEYFDKGGWSDAKGNKVRNWKQKLITWESHQSGVKQQKPQPASNVFDALKNFSLPEAAK